MTCRSPLVASLAALTIFATPGFAADMVLQAAAEAAKPAVIDSLRDMVAIESGSSDAAGLAKMADYAEGRLKALGMTVERRPITGGTGADMVIGRLTGTGKRKIMLIGHVDTVYQPGILKTQPWKIDGAKIYGPGIADDKGGIAVIFHALAILKERGWRDYAVITVALNPDEEIGSGGSGETIAALADEHDFVLSCEPTGTQEMAQAEAVLLGTAGTATATMEVTGRASHAGVAPGLGRNALVELSHQILQTRDVAKDFPGTQLNWTTASAGTCATRFRRKPRQAATSASRSPV